MKQLKYFPCFLSTAILSFIHFKTFASFLQLLRFDTTAQETIAYDEDGLIFMIIGTEDKGDFPLSPTRRLEQNTDRLTFVKLRRKNLSYTQKLVVRR